MIDTRLRVDNLNLVADVRSDRESHPKARTLRKVVAGEGAKMSLLAPDIVDLIFSPGDGAPPAGSYRRVKFV